jgi:DNA-binding transcriptional MocR family regulator
MQWFRFYSEALEDPKVQRLPPALFKTWVNLLCLASKGESGGALPDAEDCAFALRMDLDTYSQHTAELLDRGLIDARDDHLAMHNWDGRQKRSDNVTARVHKYREQKKQGETLQKRSGNALEKNRVRVEETRESTSVRDVGGVGGGTPSTPPPATKRATRATPAPDDFPLTETMRAWSTEHAPGVDIEAETSRFLDRNRANGTTYKDWLAAWRNWMTSPYAKGARAGPNGAAPLDGPIGRDRERVAVMERFRARRGM